VNDLSPSLLDAARRNVSRYADTPKVAAGIVTGSVARGDTDIASDNDTILYVREPFTEFAKARDRAVGSGGGLNGGTATDGIAPGGSWRSPWRQRPPGSSRTRGGIVSGDAVRGAPGIGGDPELGCRPSRRGYRRDAATSWYAARSAFGIATFHPSV